MTRDRAAESIEVERKYDAPAGEPLPSAAAFRAAGFTAAAPHTVQLHAQYFDTRDRALASARVAVRRRRGGKDAGWHIKERRADGVRERTWPDSEEPPNAFLEALAEYLGGRKPMLVPLAELRTERTIVVLSDEAGNEAVELADDRVDAREGASGVRRVWREWEAELLGDLPEFLDRAEQVLTAAGATPSLSGSKIARATGSLVGLARARGAAPERIVALEQMDAADQAAADQAAAAEEDA